MTKQQLIEELRGQGFGRIADMLDAEPLRVVDLWQQVNIDAAKKALGLSDSPKKKAK